MLFCRANGVTGATGLEPATSGVTGRSWRFRAEREAAGIPGNSGIPRPCRCGDWREPAGASGSLVRDQCGMSSCLCSNQSGVSAGFNSCLGSQSAGRACCPGWRSANFRWERVRAPAVLVAADVPGKLSALPRLVELEQEFAELGEAFRAELLRPGGLDFADGFADDADRGRAAWGEGDPLGA